MKPAWWQLYGLVVLLVTRIAVLDASIPTGILRSILESIAVVFAFGLMLVWRPHNRTAFELGRRR